LALLCEAKKTQYPGVKYCDIIAHNLNKAGWVAAVSQARITRADNFGLPPQSARTPDALLCVLMKG
jgi:hypothetical protein